MSRKFHQICANLTDGPIWKKPEYFRAYYDLIRMSDHEPGKIEAGTAYEWCDRGECLVTESFLMERWEWPRKKLRCFFAWSEKRDYIVRTTSKEATKIRVAHLYTEAGPKEGPSTGPDTGQPRGQGRGQPRGPSRGHNTNINIKRESERESGSAGEVLPGENSGRSHTENPLVSPNTERIQEFDMTKVTFSSLLDTPEVRQKFEEFVIWRRDGLGIPVHGLEAAQELVDPWNALKGAITGAKLSDELIESMAHAKREHHKKFPPQWKSVQDNLRLKFGKRAKEVTTTESKKAVKEQARQEAKSAAQKAREKAVTKKAEELWERMDPAQRSALEQEALKNCTAEMRASYDLYQENSVWQATLRDVIRKDYHKGLVEQDMEARGEDLTGYQ